MVSWLKRELHVFVACKEEEFDCLELLPVTETMNGFTDAWLKVPDFRSATFNTSTMSHTAGRCEIVVKEKSGKKKKKEEKGFSENTNMQKHYPTVPPPHILPLGSSRVTKS